MSAGKLAGKLLVKPKDLTTAKVVRQVGGAPGVPTGGGGGGDFGDFGAFVAAPAPVAAPAQPQAAPEDPGWEDVPGRDPFPAFFHEESAKEKLAAGKDTPETTYEAWCLLGADGRPPVSEDEYLKVAGEGIVNVAGVVRRPTEGLCRIDATRSAAG